MLGKSTSQSEYEEVLPKYTQNSVIAGCHTHGGPAGAMGQSHQINVCHTENQMKMNSLSGGSNKIKMHMPQVLMPPISDTTNSKVNLTVAGGSLLNTHQNHQQTCGPNGEYCKNLGDADGTQQEGGSKKTKKKHHKKRKQNKKTKKNKKNKKNKNSNKNRKIKKILKKTKNSKNSKISNKNKKSRKTKKVRFY